MQNLVGLHECVIFQNFSKSKLAQIFKKSGDFAQNLAQNNFFCPIGIWMGHFFLKNGISMVYFQNPRRHIPTKPKLEYPPSSPGASCMLILIKCWPNRSYCHIIFTHSKWLKYESKTFNIPYNDDNNDLLCRFLVCSSMWWNRVKKLIKLAENSPKLKKKVL